MMAVKYMGQGLRRDTVLQICTLSKHQFYYQPKANHNRGCPASEHTLKGAVKVDNGQIVELIKHIQSDEDTNYGYRKMYYYLKQQGFTINHKKVYRLMKEAGLLKQKVRPDTEKTYARYRIVTPERPLEVLEMDIKMVWTTQYRRHAYILNIIDTFTRMVLYWTVGYEMRQAQVKHAWQHVIENYLQPADLLNKGLHVELRNDNGPQFLAKTVTRFLAENHIKQVFIHPYTPQENGHVESFHHILKKALGNQPFWSLQELEKRLEKFYDKYNNTRIHSSIAWLSPALFWQCWEDNMIERKVMADKKVRFKLKVAYQELSGYRNQREVLCSDFTALEGVENQQNLSLNDKEVNGPNTSAIQPSVLQSPSVVLC